MISRKLVLAWLNQRRIVKGFLVCLILISLCGLSSAQVVNGGFESGETGWSISATGYCGSYVEAADYEATIANTGEYFLFVSGRENPTGGNVNVSQTVYLDGSGIVSLYCFELYSRVDGVDWFPGPLGVYIDNTLLGTITDDGNAYPYDRYNFTFSGFSGAHNLRLSYPSSTVSVDQTGWLIDDISIDSVSFPVNGSIFSSAGVFEYGKLGWYSVVMENGGTGTYYVDVYGLDNSAYIFLNTYSFQNTQSGANIVEITAPGENKGYNKLYAVLRNADNVTYSNTTDPLVVDADSYFYFDPAIINQDETTTLHYKSGYNYTTRIVCDYELVRGVLYDTFQPISDVWALEESTYDCYANAWYHSTSSDKSGVRGFGLYTYPLSGNVLERTERLAWATYQVDGSYTGPKVPQYDPERSGRAPADQSKYPSNSPAVPPAYNPPSFPHPSDPSHADGDNGTPNPGDNSTPDPGDNPNYPGDEIGDYNSSHYNGDNGTWEYNNGTGSGDGFYPVDVPGNTSVDTSRFQGFYDTIDSFYGPLNGTVNGFLTFVLGPITSIGGYVNQTKEYFTNSTTGLISNNVITECVVPVFTRLPPIIVQLIVFGLVLSLIGLLLRGG